VMPSATAMRSLSFIVPNSSVVLDVLFEAMSALKA
jgi:hypothetical protein